MSFQGDVGGIGLAELLQSLARGREGVLSLRAKAGLSATIGVTNGQLHLLPEGEEDPDIWRELARRAWADIEPNGVDALRMIDIARARRTELLYQLLDSDGVHFRFQPGALPAKPNEPALSASEPGLDRGGVRRDLVWTAPVSVEALLLEYARLKDEAQAARAQWPDAQNAVLFVLERHGAPRELQRFVAQCDGNSSLHEISDRLGLPLRQVLLWAIYELRRGGMRMASPDELMALAHKELLRSAVTRAAARLRAWLVWGPYGPLSALEAALFDAEWNAGRLQHALRALTARESRCILRRLDHALAQPLAAQLHWVEQKRVHPSDRISGLHELRVSLRASVDPNLPSARDLLATAHTFLDERRRMAAAAVLRVAAGRAPEHTSARLELGQGFLLAGQPAEAAPWLLEACGALCDAGETDRALGPLKSLVDALPQHREVRRLYARVRAKSVRKTLVRRNSLITFAVLAALATGAVVQYKNSSELEERLTQVNAHMAEPAAALETFDRLFQGTLPQRATDLRRELVERKKRAELEARTEWVDQYTEAATECSLGDPRLGLERTLWLAPPPKLGADTEALPLVIDLYNSLAARLEGEVNTLPRAVEDAPAQIQTDERVAELLAGVARTLSGRELSSEARDFASRITALEQRVAARDEARAQLRLEKLRQQNLARQDLLLAAARAHTSAGDYERALSAYDKLLSSDDSQKIAPLLEKEIAAVRAHASAINDARALAARGEHARAFERLQAVLGESATKVRLTWHVDSVPSRAIVTLPDGSERRTPFSIESTWNEAFHLRFTLPGAESVEIQVDHPANQRVFLPRVADRVWTTPARVELLPLAVGEDHVVCDRSGTLARLGSAGEIVWTRKFGKLGGLARPLMFLPKRPGYLLLVTEDGEAWVVSAADGSAEGPWNAPSAPAVGPWSTTSGLRLALRDSSTYEWEAAPTPRQVEASSEEPTSAEQPEGVATGAWVVLQRRLGQGSVLRSPWSKLEVLVEGTQCVVRASEAEGPLWTTRRAGEWNYVAWETPSARTPRGRLWLSDASGLRSFAP